MKTIQLLIMSLLIAAPLSAQYNCSKFYPFSEGATSEITMTNKKGKVEGIVVYKVHSIRSEGGVDIAKMSNTIKDAKGNAVIENEYDVTCKEGVVSFDFKSLNRPQMLQQMEGVEYDMKGTNIDLPNNLKVGQELPEGKLEIAISYQGMNMNMNTYLKDRRVEGKETITTPAGTFECYIISSTMEMQSMASQMMRSKQWIAEGVGVVKVIDYDKKGNVRSKGLLTSFTK